MTWQPIDTAPARLRERFRCLIQSEAGEVFEGYCELVEGWFGGGELVSQLWYRASNAYCPNPKYWMPLPEPKKEK